MWILSQWTATSLLLLAYNQTQRRILSIFPLPAPASVLDVWVVVTNKRGVYAITLDWRISILGARKLRFFCESNLAHANTNNMCRNSWLSLNLPSNYGVNETISTNFAFFPLRSQCGDAEHRLSLEQALQQTLRPIYQFGLGSTLYWNVGELERHVLVSHRLNQQWHLDVDWYVDTRNAHEPNIVLYLSSNLTIICVFFDFFTCWDLIHWWNLNVRNYCISSWSWLHIFTMQIESKFDGTFSVKSSAATQAHFAVPELRISTC